MSLSGLNFHKQRINSNVTKWQQLLDQRTRKSCATTARWEEGHRLHMHDSLPIVSNGEATEVAQS